MSQSNVTVLRHDEALPAAAFASTPLTPMAMLSQAVANGMPPETVERLMGLVERWEANQARKAFNEAFAAFKAEAVIVERNRKVTDGPLKGRSYAELVSFVEAATPALSKHGLSASWFISKDERDWIEVTCTVEHVLGGSKSVSLGGPPDAGGAKNALQARVSTVTYLERATFKAACGLAEQGDDRDGGAPPKPAPMITEEQAMELRDLAESVGANLGKFLAFIKVETLADIRAEKFADAVALLKQGGRR